MATRVREKALQPPVFGVFWKFLEIIFYTGSVRAYICTGARSLSRTGRDPPANWKGVSSSPGGGEAPRSEDF